MPATIFMRKQGDCLRPVDAAGYDDLADVPSGKNLKVSIVAPRNEAYHRQFFAALNFAFQHQDTWPTKDSFRARITVGVGHGDIVEREGKIVLCPKSIAFSKMDDIDFRQFAMRVVDEICKKVVPNMPRQAVVDYFDILKGNSGALGEDVRNPLGSRHA